MPAATSSPSPNICARRRVTTRWNAGCGPRSSSSSRGTPKGWDSPGGWPGRWFGRRIGRAGFTSRRYAPELRAPRHRNRLRTYVSLVTMAKPRTAAENKAAKAQAQAVRKAAARERRAQLWQAFNIQRQEDKRLLPYMIGAFVLIAGGSVAVGVWAGGVPLGRTDPRG